MVSIRNYQMEITRGAQIPGVSHHIFVDPQYGIFFMSTIWHLDF